MVENNPHSGELPYGTQVTDSLWVGQVGETYLNSMTVRMPDGSKKVRPQVVRPDAVAVLPVRIGADGAREGLFVRQDRPAARRYGIWEVPAGKLEVGEQPGEAATRELREETGYVTTGLAALALGLLVSPGYTTERMNIYAATVADERAAQRPEDAHIESRWRPLDRMFSPDMKTWLTVLLVQRDNGLWNEVTGR